MVALVARQGRQLQRYSKNGGRHVVGCIPYKFKIDRPGSECAIEHLEVLVISSRKGNSIIFPKGGWEEDETMYEAARRETLEEAGVRGNIEGRLLGKWRYDSRSHDAAYVGIMFALNVTEELDEWPEMSFRRRKWVTVVEAKEGCPHLWMREALDRLVSRFSRSSERKPADHLAKNTNTNPVTSSALTPSTPITSPSSTNFLNLVPIKLGRNNYVPWRTLFTAVLRGHDLMGYVEGSFSCPQASSMESDAVNLRILQWPHQDQLLLGWIFEKVLPQAANQTTSYGVWTTLARLFASKSQARLLQLRFELQQTMKKGGKSMSDYITHALSPISDQDLSLEYEALVVSITTHAQNTTMEDLQGLLLNHEIRHTQPLEPVPPANMALRLRPSFPTSWGGGGRGRYGNRGRFFVSHGGHSSSCINGPNPLSCQICNRIGHFALNCFKRLDMLTIAPTYYPPVANYVGNDDAQSGDGSWYPDSSATHHVASDFSNLSISTPYLKSVHPPTSRLS